MAWFDDDEYLEVMAALAARDRHGDDTSFSRWQMEFAVSSCNLMLLAREMAEALGEDHDLTRRFRAWSAEAVKLAGAAN